MAFHTLTVADVREEIPGVARTLTFEVPRDLKARFLWTPGQHVTLRFRIDGEEVRRSYSVSASRLAGDPLRITVKRVPGGLVSNHINDSLGAGSRVDVMPPFGGFVVKPDPRRRRTCYLIGAGSGITPLYAMLRSLLAAERWSSARLLYGNRDAGSILFAGELESLVAGQPRRLAVHHVLSRPNGARCWRKGRIDAAAVEAWIAENPPYAQDAHYFVCGPGGMNRTVAAGLADLDVPAGRVHAESYDGEALDLDDTVGGVDATARIVLGGRRHVAPVEAGQTILAAARAAGLEPPYSCEAGVCGACRAELVGGSVHMRSTAALTDTEVDGGAVLTCQSVATSSHLRIRY